jgi:hypothetical protein
MSLLDSAMQNERLAQRLYVEARKNVALQCELVLRWETDIKRRVKLVDMHLEMLHAAQTYKSLVIKASPETGKTNLITFMLSLNEAGNDPEHYTAIIGSRRKKPTATSLMRVIKNYVEGAASGSGIPGTEALGKIFPELSPSVHRWGVEELELSSHSPAIKEATWTATGMDAGWQGARHTRQIFDDMNDKVLARSKYLCEQAAEWEDSGYDRLHEHGKRAHIENTFESWDVGLILAEKYGWHLHYARVRDPKTGKTRFPDKYPQERIDNYPPDKAEPNLDCKPRSAGARPFPKAHVDKARLLGLGTTMLGQIDPSTLPSGVQVVHGVDPASSEAETADKSAIFTGLVGPPGYFLETLPLRAEGAREIIARLPDHAQVIQLLWMMSGRVGQPVLLRWMADLWQRYRGTFTVETNGVQRWLLQMLEVEYPYIPVISFRTGSNKHDADAGVKAENNALSTGMYIFPTQLVNGVYRSEDEVEGLCGDLIGHAANDPHTPDRIMSMWICRNGARILKPQHHAVGTIDLSPHNPNALAFSPINQALQQLGVVATTQPANPNQATIDEQVRRRFGF